MDKINLPQELRDYESLLKLLAIIFPCSVKTIEPDLFQDERLKLVTIFRENSAKKRHNFFSDPLIKFLWTRVFIKANPLLIKTYLRKIKTDRNNGSTTIQNFIANI